MSHPDPPATEGGASTSSPSPDPNPETPSSRSGHPAIELRQIHKYYGEGDTSLHVLKNIDLQVHEGEYLAITGPSGSGKSTLLNILGCLDRPTSGNFILDGVDVSQLEDDDLSTIRNEKLGFIFQSFNLIPQLSVLENVSVPLLYGPLNRHEAQDRSLALLDAVGLSERTHHRPAQLSGGERQRVAIARALVNDPVVILADEPTGNLDSKTGREVLALMERLHSEGRTVVMITHDLSIADRAQREIHIKDGRIGQRVAS